MQKGENEQAGYCLQSLAWIAEIERSRVGDVYTADLAAYYGKFGERNRLALVQAREALAQGAKYYDKQDLTAAAGLELRAPIYIVRAGIVEHHVRTRRPA